MDEIKKERVGVYITQDGDILDEVCEIGEDIILYSINMESFLRLNMHTLAVRDIYADSGL
jgi:hypothetical protein